MKPSQSTESQTPAMSGKKSSVIQTQADYQILGTVGKGAYGCVSLASKGGKLYAIKRIQKKKLARQCKQYQAFVEKELLRKINHPGIIKMAKCYQDPKNLNYVLEYCHGGDFTSFLRSNHKLFTEQMRVFYVAQIVSILQYLHSNGITHRDLKPENIMLSKDGHLKLIDFGTAQITRCTLLDDKFKQDIEKQKKAVAAKRDQPTEQEPNQEEEASPKKRRSTFVGTCYYLSPQLLQHNICEPPSDLWALGCIIYQLYYLQPPFKAGTQFQLFEKIKNGQISFPKNDDISQDAIDLIKRLIVKIPEDRLGSNQKQGLKWKDLKAHPYFKHIKFENLSQQFVPHLKQQDYNPQQHQVKLQKIKSQIEGDHEQLLSNKQEIIFAGIGDRKTFASYNPCYLILKKGFILLSIKQNQAQQNKLVITPLSQNIVAQLLDNNKFKIIVDQCTWTVRTNEAKKWVQVLNEEYKK